MRTLLDHTIKANIDISKLSNKRINIEALGNGEFRFTSKTISLPKAWVHQFLYRFLDRRAKIRWVKGTCSCPSGYEFEQTTEAFGY